MVTTKKVSLLSTSLAALFCLSTPAFAQSFGDAYSSQVNSVLTSAGHQTMNYLYKMSISRTIEPQGPDAVVIPSAGRNSIGMGVNTAGTVRVNNLVNLEALLNIIASGMEIIGIAWGGPTMIMGLLHMAAESKYAMIRVLMGCAGVTGGLAGPGVINWLVASARDANLV